MTHVQIELGYVFEQFVRACGAAAHDQHVAHKRMQELVAQRRLLLLQVKHRLLMPRCSQAKIKWL